jgi:FkbM family methyltransferase
MSKTVIKADNHAEDIDLLMNELSSVDIKGVIHLGAHRDEEVEAYFSCGFTEVILIEANPELYQYLLARFAEDKRVKVYNYSISESVGWIDFYIYQSAKGNVEPFSVLKMKKIKDIAKTLSTSATIKGAFEILNQFSIIICEIIKIEVYEGATLEAKVDKLLELVGFSRKFTIYHELYDETGRFPARGETIFQNKRLA